jgi:cell division septation protein DedD
VRDDEHAPAVEETGYYEVALSNRQLLGAFCLFSLVLAGAFLMGVWFAREGQALGPTRQTAAPAARGANEDLVDAEVGAGAVLDEMKFFSEEPRPGGGASARPNPPAGSTPPSTSAAAPIPPPAAPVRPPPSPAPPAANTKPATTPAPGPGAPVHVQVFSSPDAGQARRVLEQLRQAGYAAALSPIEVGNRTMHRVRVGPFRDRAEAERVAEQVKARFKLSTWITTY